MRKALPTLVSLVVVFGLLAANTQAFLAFGNTAQYCGCDATGTSTTVLCSSVCAFDVAVPVGATGGFVQQLNYSYSVRAEKTTPGGTLTATTNYALVDSDLVLGNNDKVVGFNTAPTSGTNGVWSSALNTNDGLNRTNCPTWDLGYCTWYIRVNASATCSLGQTCVVNSTISAQGYVWNASSAPVITLNTPANGSILSNSTPSFSFTSIDSNSTTTNCTVYADGVAVGNNPAVANNTLTTITSSALFDGVKSWQVQCIDGDGEVGVSSGRTLTIDTTPPVVTLITPSNGTLTNTNTPGFVFNAVDALSPTLFCNLYANGLIVATNASTLSGANTTIVSPALFDGLTSWSVACTDGGANSGTSTTRTLTVDTTAPSIAVQTPTNGTFIANQTPGFTFTTSDAIASTTSCTLFIDGTAHSSATIVPNSTLTTITSNTTLTEGSHTWALNCTDGAGNSKTTTASQVIVDVTAPTVSLNSPASGDIVNTPNPVFNFTVIDNLAPIMSCTVKVAGSVVGSNTTVYNNTPTTIVGTVASGTSNWTINCIDAAGTTNTSETRTIVAVLPTPTPTPGQTSQTPGGQNVIVTSSGTYPVSNNPSNSGFQGGAQVTLTPGGSSSTPTPTGQANLQASPTAPQGSNGNPNANNNALNLPQVFPSIAIPSIQAITSNGTLNITGNLFAARSTMAPLLGLLILALLTGYWQYSNWKRKRNYGKTLLDA